MFTEGAQCTANFVITDDAGDVLVGYAAHCAGKGGQTDTNGCSTRSHDLGTRVRFARGATAQKCRLLFPPFLKLRSSTATRLWLTAFWI